MKQKGLREKSATTSAKERSVDEDREVQNLAVLKRIKRHAKSDEKRARLMQQQIFIPQWPELAIMDYYNYVSIKSFARSKNLLTFSILVDAVCGQGQIKQNIKGFTEP